MKETETFYSKEIYKKIKSDILSLRIKDGEFITLSELAEKYQVSKTPIRDALCALEIEGYIKSLSRKGYLIKPVTQKSIREVFEMRMIYEIEAAKIAAKRADDAELQNILKLAKEFPEKNIKYEERLDLFNEINIKFHTAIIEATHNSMLIESGSYIMDKLSRILISDSYNLDFSNEKKEHIEIAQALINREVNKVEKLVTDHIIELEDRVFNNGGRA